MSPVTLVSLSYTEIRMWGGLRHTDAAEPEVVFLEFNSELDEVPVKF